MKTLTELSGSLIRTAATAIAEARRSLPREEKPPEAPAAEEAPPSAEAPVGPDAPAAVEAPGTVDAAIAEAAGGPVAEADAPVPLPPAPPVTRPAAAPKPARVVESEAVKAALDEAVAKATGTSGDRLTMLRAAVEAVGPRTADVRLVRVFGLDEQVSGAHSIGEHQYVVDYMPSSMKQQAAPKEKDGRGGGRRGAGRGGGEGRGAKAGATGGFSMDSLRDDRKNERGGKGRPGGGPPRGGAPGKPPGGGPKK